MTQRGILTLLVLLTAWANAQDTKIVCRQDGAQLELNQCAADDFKRADKELNRVWKEIQAKYADQPLFLKKLTTAQRFWLQFRDAELEAKFPIEKQENARIQYGSVYPMCWNGYKAGLTNARVRDLKIWLTGGQEGDACLGSVKMPSELSGAK
jgi:uncharacterized protein YecT (DUF1311 family)